MNQLNTAGIILARTDFGEADRILTVLTPDHGKLRLMAKGVRRVKSKLAGGIELFSVSDITFIRGRGDIGTLVSSRLQRHYDHIVSDLDRTMVGYDLIKILNRATEDEPEPEYFGHLQATFEALNDGTVALELIRVWFSAQLLKFAGHTPNLTTDDHGQPLEQVGKYGFNFEAMAFAPSPQDGFTSNHIKYARLLFSGNPPKILQQVSGSGALVAELTPIIQTMLKTYVKA